MNGPEWALQQALIATLAADAGVQARLGAPPRVYDEPPPDATFPYLTIGRVESQAADGDAAPGHELIVHLHVWSRYGGRKEAQEIVAAARTALHDAALAMEAWRLANLRATYADVFRAGDGLTTHGIFETARGRRTDRGVTETRMAAQKGKDLLLKIGDGGAPETFAAVAGIRAKTISLNARTVDATDADSPNAWRELMPGAGVKSVSISGSGIFKDTASDLAVRDVFFSQVARNWQVIVPDFGTLEGPFLIAALEYSGRHDGEAQYALTLSSAGEITFAAA